MNQDGKYIFKSKCIWRLVLSRGLHCSNVFTDIILSDSKCLCFIHFRISTKKLFSRNKLKRIHNKFPSYFVKFATIFTLFCWITTSQTATQFISKAVIWANKVAINKHRPTKYDFGNSHVFCAEIFATHARWESAGCRVRLGVGLANCFLALVSFRYL